MIGREAGRARRVGVRILDARHAIRAEELVRGARAVARGPAQPEDGRRCVIGERRAVSAAGSNRETETHIERGPEHGGRRAGR
jgi:hypothetical protein